MPLYKDEKALLGYKNEHLLYLEDNGRLIMDVRGKDNSVGVNYAICAQLGCSIVSHNHPGKGGPHTPPDVVTAIKYRIRSSRVITKDKLYILREPDEGWSDKLFYEVVYPSFKRIYEEKFKEFNMKVIENDDGTFTVYLRPDGMSQETSFPIWEDIWKNVCKECGAKYTIEKIKPPQKKKANSPKN